MQNYMTESNPTLTAGMLTEAIKDVPLDTPVEIEGCDCINLAGRVEILDDKVYIRMKIYD